MTKNTKIEWADHTFNPWIGCTNHCYAENMMDTRLKVVKWGAGQERKRTSASNWQQPIKWNEEAKKLGVRHRVFCASLADVFDNNVNPEWLADLLTLIRLTSNLDWLLLTKRIGNLNYRLEQAFKSVESDDTTESTIDFNRFVWSWINGSPPNNVWLGITVCNQKEADRDIPKLLAVPAAKRFLSMEPLLGSVKIDFWLDQLPAVVDQRPRLDWVIVGGESGPVARPMHPSWVRSLRDQCTSAGVPFFFKQWGKKGAGRLLNNREFNEVPA